MQISFTEFFFQYGMSIVWKHQSVVQQAAIDYFSASGGAPTSIKALFEKGQGKTMLVDARTAIFQKVIDTGGCPS